MSKPKLVVGQQVFYVSRNNANSKSLVTVEKVGRKWIELSNNRRMTVDGWVVDSNVGYAGEVYASEAEYQAWVLLKNELHSLKKGLEGWYEVPAGVTLEDIRNAKALLKLQ